VPAQLTENLLRASGLAVAERQEAGILQFAAPIMTVC
jgi:hypothetical protein